MTSAGEEPPVKDDGQQKIDVSTVDAYFSAVNDFFEKTFRDETKLFLSIRADQDGGPVLQHGTSTTGSSTAPSNSNSLFISPRLVINNDGSTYGKFKLGGKLDVDGMADVNLRVIVDTHGKITSKLDVDKTRFENIAFKGSVELNAIEPPSKDLVSVELEYKTVKGLFLRSQCNFSAAATKAAFESGIKYLNANVGMGLEREWANNSASGRVPTLRDSQDNGALYHNDGSGDQDGSGAAGSLYVAAGIHGTLKNWCCGMRINREGNFWSRAEIGMIQKIRRDTFIGCHYFVDLFQPSSFLRLGVGTNVPLRLPFLLAPYPLKVGFKATTSGDAALSFRGSWQDALWWGVTVRKNLVEGAPVQLSLAVEVQPLSGSE